MLLWSYHVKWLKSGKEVVLVYYTPVHITPRAELKARAARLQSLMSDSDLDGAIIVQNADLFYFTGTVQRANLFIPAQGKPVLLVKKNLERAKRESTLENIVPLSGMKELPSVLATYTGHKLNRIGFELDVLPVNQFFYYQRLLGDAKIVDASRLIRQVRTVKSEYEIGLLKDAAGLNQAMFSSVTEFLREGITEVELAGQLENVYRRRGHQCHIRMRGFNMEIVYGHLMSGWNLAIPTFFDGPTGGSGLNTSFPQGAGMKTIGRDEPVMVDYVGVLNGYMVDQARIFCIGRLPDKLVRAYHVSIEIQEVIKEKSVPGASCNHLYEIALEVARKYGLGEHFMGYPEPVAFIGHGLGIELDELPVLARGYDLPLEQNMVFALEPKFVFPEGAVGIENTYRVTANGLESITEFDESIGYL